ncbi:exosortase-associated protein EpsI, B-type [Denitromonas halophila]|uniref:EpsI family protein n=1 Tax=Denitromonas halophila TaxID=1629404 RepID=A0A557QXJ7_9RHOO|nr:exosortase-associated protein EpsI, B-type [Denitromonas halophila]TVO57623.1 EpsI family protein [Denitromonas halophila]
MTTDLTMLRRSIFLFLFFMASAVIAHVMTPLQVPREGGKASLAKIIPKEFGTWAADSTSAPVVVAQDVQANLDRYYSDILTRTYVGAGGQRVMVSIAYGEDQSRTNQVHKPEICYPAQGFSILSERKGYIETANGSIPVMHLATRMGRRYEPVTYWILIGNKVVRGALEQNIARISFGLDGAIPDGLLFRVSSIDQDAQRAYAQQSRFVADLLGALDPSVRARLIGSIGTVPAE